MAALAVFCASDNRFAHLTLCRADLTLASVELDCSPDEVCCPADAAASATANPAALVCDSCLCCSQAPAPHQGESDARAPIERNPVKAHGLLAWLSAPLSIEPPRLATDAPLAVALSTGGTARFLRCNHLRF